MMDNKKGYSYDYNKMDNSHYSMPSMYGKMCREQYQKQPRYAEPGPATGKMVASTSGNAQVGP